MTTAIRRGYCFTSSTRRFFARPASPSFEATGESGPTPYPLRRAAETPCVVVNAATWPELNRDTAPAVVSYTLTAEDLAGPFTPIPEEVADQAKLPALGYENLAEALGEKFHASPKLIAMLNPGIALDRAGVVILVPNVVRSPLEKAGGITIRVSRNQGAVEAQSMEPASFWPAIQPPSEARTIRFPSVPGRSMELQ